MRTRQIAVAMVETGFVREARVTFAWGPRDERPSGVELEADGRVLDAAAVARWMERFDPSLAATHAELGLGRVNWESCARAGHFGRASAWEGHADRERRILTPRSNLRTFMSQSWVARCPR